MPRMMMKCIKVPPTLINELIEGHLYQVNIGAVSASLYLPDGGTWPFNVGNGTMYAFNLSEYFEMPEPKQKPKRRKLNLKRRKAQ